VKTRSEAVAYLRSRGLHAAERDWALGETIFAATGGQDADGIIVYARAMYIVPRSETWTSFEFARPREDDDVEMSLQEACARVERLLALPSHHPPDRRR
jgi:hypothetical protein